MFCIKKYLLFVLIVLNLKLASANNYQGYYVTNQNDTVNAIFNLATGLLAYNNTLENLQWSIECTDESEHKILLKPSEIKEVTIFLGSEVIKLKSLPNSLQLNSGFLQRREFLFLRLIKDGRVKLYKYYKVTNTSSMNGYGTITPSSTLVEKYILESELGKLMIVPMVSFKKEMKFFFYKCPALVEKIAKRTYTYEQIELIVHTYNYNCELVEPTEQK